MGDGLGLCEAQVHVVIAGNAVLSAPKQSACSLCVCVCAVCDDAVAGVGAQVGGKGCYKEWGIRDA